LADVIPQEALRVGRDASHPCGVAVFDRELGLVTAQHPRACSERHVGPVHERDPVPQEFPLIKKSLTATLTALLLAFGLAAAPAANAADPSVKAIDTAATITDPNWFRRAYNAGFRLYVMHSTAWGTCDPWWRTQTQLQMALDAGLKIAVYTRDPSCWENGIKAAGPDLMKKLQFFALDVETGGVQVTRAMVDGVKSLNVRPVIYTGSGMWPQMMNNSTAFSDVPLWDTDARNINYNKWVANYLSPTPVQYGGWNTPTNMRVGVQQKFEQNLNGVRVDLNSFNATFLLNK
jgi:hypothetical protein